MILFDTSSSAESIVRSSACAENETIASLILILLVEWWMANTGRTGIVKPYIKIDTLNKFRYWDTPPSWHTPSSKMTFFATFTVVT
jgi:hypothetical protein